MPLVLAPLEESDIEDFATVDAEAMKGWAYAEAMMKPGTDRREGIIGFMKADWGKNPNQHWLKVTDTETNELVAGAMWIDILDPPQLSTKEKGNAKLEADKKMDTDPNVSPMWAHSRRLGQEFDDEFVKDAPRMLLAVLVTHPRHQRRGAGGMLVGWGCKRADEHGVMCQLTSSEAGLVGYMKQGFEVKKISELDLRPYGYDSTELRRYMLRPAKVVS